MEIEVRGKLCKRQTLGSEYYAIRRPICDIYSDFESSSVFALFY